MLQKPEPDKPEIRSRLIRDEIRKKDISLPIEQRFHCYGTCFILHVFFAILIISAFGCETPNQSGPPSLSMDDFAEVYATAVILSQGKDSLQARAIVDSLLAGREVTVHDMEQAVVSYEKDQEQWRLFWALVVKKMQDEASAVVKSDSASQSVQ